MTNAAISNFPEHWLKKNLKNVGTLVEHRACLGASFLSIVPPFLWRDESYSRGLIAVVQRWCHKSSRHAGVHRRALLFFHFSLHNVCVDERESAQIRLKVCFDQLLTVCRDFSEITGRERRGHGGAGHSLRVNQWSVSFHEAEFLQSVYLFFLCESHTNRTLVEQSQFTVLFSLSSQGSYFVLKKHTLN